MSRLRAAEILKQFADGIKDTKANLDTDISSLLEEYLTESGLRELNENENQLPNFPEVAVILQHSGVIYSRQVDHLFLLVQNAARSFSTPENRDTVDTNNVDKVSKRTKKRATWSEFKHIELEEANNIDIKEKHEPKPITMLPKAFFDFEPRIISDNDIQLKDYNGETIGLMSDYRVNWNTDENFMLCDDMDFCTLSNPSEVANVIPTSMLSPSDSGHTSDCYVDFTMDSGELITLPDDIGSPEPSLHRSPEHALNTSITSDISIAPSTPSTVVEKQAASKAKKRKLPFTPPVAKKIATKFTLATQLTGTVEKLSVTPSEFSLPFLGKFIDQRISEKKNIKRFLEDIYSDCDLDYTFFMNKISPAFKKKPPMTWSRQEIYKKLRISQLKTDEMDKGFYEDDGEDLDHNLEALEKVCSRLSMRDEDVDTYLESSDTHFAEEDDIPDDNHTSNEDNVFEPSMSRRLAEADSTPAPFQFAGQSDISKRVEAWHMSIQEKLKEAEKRRKFDIDEYSNNIIGTFKTNEKNVINFSDVMKTQPAGEVARYFLTTLMLANHSKVIIKETEPLSCGDFQMSLGTVDTKQKKKTDNSKLFF